MNQYYADSDERDKRQGDAKQDKSAPKEWIDILLAISTFLLFVATVALCVIAYLQWGTMKAHKTSLEGMADYMEKGLAETKTAACAAKKSSDTAHATFVNAHRPRLKIRYIKVTGSVGDRIVGNFLVFNVGDTKAVLKAGYSELLPCADGFPAGAPYERAQGAPFADIELAPGEYTSVDFPTRVPDFTPMRLMDSDASRAGNYFLLGWIEYVDEVGRPHRMAFARKYERKMGHSTTNEIDPEYNYDD